MKIGVVGQGYVGLPLALSLANLGDEVIGYDIDKERVSKLKSGISPIENIKESELSQLLKHGRYFPTVDQEYLAESDVFVITVPTPVDNKKPDLTALKSAARTIGKYVKAKTLVINESTSYPGTLREIIMPIVLEGKLHESVLFGCSPERIDPSNLKFSLMNTPRLVAGISSEALERTYEFYARLTDQVIKVKSPEIAEASKLLENTFRLVNIAFINEFSEYCSRKNIDILEVLDAASSKPFGFMKFTPSVGIGGHCIPVDPYYLLESAEKSQANLPTVAAALHSNSTRAKRIADRIEEVYLNQPGRILIEGITYKSNVKDIRESAALSMALELKSRGHDVRWSDPLFEDEILNLRKASEKDQFDLVILCVTHINTDLKSLNKKASKVVDLTFNKNEESFDFI